MEVRARSYSLERLITLRPAKGLFHFSVVVGQESFKALKDTWDHLVTQDSQSSPYLNWGSVNAWLDNLAAGSEVLTILVQEDGEIKAIIPFYAKPRFGYLSEQRLQMVGFETLNHFPSLSEEPVYASCFEEAEEEMMWVQVAEYMHEVLRHSKWDSIAYRRWTHLMERPRWERRRENIVELREYLRGSEIVQLPDTWDLYKKQLSKSMRENLPYYPKKLHKDGRQWEVHIATGYEAAQSVATLKTLHHQRVEEDPSGSHRDYMLHPNKPGYLTALCTNGEGYIATLVVDGVAVAAQMFMRKQDCLLALHSGFQLEYNKYSPLFILQSHIFRQALENGVRRLNLLPGNAQWQNRWTAEATHSIEVVTIASKRSISRVRQLRTTLKSRKK
jgi:hypothetical protein